MIHVDLRKLPAAAQEERRRQVVGLRQAGQTYDAIAAQVGLTRTGVFDICKRFAEQGAAGLKTRPRGPAPGHGRFLDADQEVAVRDLVRRHTPDALDLPFALWSRAAGRWLRLDYPAIAARAKAQGGTVFWGDETGLRSDDVRGRSYAPRGRTPEVRVPHKRAGLGLISAVTNKGELRWMVLDGAVTAPSLIRFLARLVRDVGRKVFLILDRLPVHRSARVRGWLAGREVEIEVFHLPGYSPELNPDEGVNGDLKQAVARKEPARSKQQLKHAVVGHMRKPSKLPHRVRNF